MKYPTPLITAALLGLLITGCSKHSPAATPSKVTDLGVVEVSSGIPIRRDLGDGKACVITPTIITNGSARFVKMTMTIEQPDATGTIQKLACPWVQAIAGEAAEWKVGDIDIRLTTKI